MNNKLVAAVVLLFALPASAHAMKVSTFLQKAEALQKKGPIALFSKDISLLKKEVTNAGGELRLERLAAEKAGRKPAYCPPDKTSLGSDELLAHMRAMPAPERDRQEVKDALRSLMARKYPCRS
jgi:hypothetical protein